MSVYSVNRRRAILLLVLSSILLLTLDLRGNPFIDKARVGFAKILEPFQTAGDVIATPIKNAWHGATDYQRLEKANQDLQDELARERGDQLAARAIYGDYQDLLALNRLSTKYQTVTARVVGTAPGNFSQTVDIDKGSNDGIKVGMPVVNFAGLVGKITTVYSDRSVVLLVTDADYAIECKVSGSNQPVGAASTSTTVNTTPSGLTPDQLNPTTTTSTTTTLPTADTTVETSTSTTSTTIATGGTTGASTGVTSTTSSVPLVPRETGGCEGRGSGQLPAMRFVSENPVFGPIDIGAVVSTAGGSKSLAPPDIIIGEVVNKVERGESEGPLLEIKLAADLNHLSLVQVVQYNPTNG